ncbi:MAG: GMP synthase subunit A [Candidatus Micrarchaeota archaeon]|nr:GMP synthase subunit A [Candidatus Micrarchaeota archaeon]
MKIIIFDLGGQYAHLIWRNLRDLDVDTKLVNKSIAFSEINDCDGIIFSGGPSSVVNENYGVCEQIISETKKGSLNIPILGICLGHQLISHRFGGKVERGKKGEYGLIQVKLVKSSRLLTGLVDTFDAWASHFDVVSEIPDNFHITAVSVPDNICEVIEHEAKPIFGVQFHPEVHHTKVGQRIFQNFVDFCK